MTPGKLNKPCDFAVLAQERDACIAADALLLKKVVLGVGALRVSVNDNRICPFDDFETGGDAGVIFEICQIGFIHLACQNVNAFLFHDAQFADGDHIDIDRIFESDDKGP